MYWNVYVNTLPHRFTRISKLEPQYSREALLLKVLPLDLETPNGPLAFQYLVLYQCT